MAAEPKRTAVEARGKFVRETKPVTLEEFFKREFTGNRGGHLA